jgi:hypothetical protein
MHEDLGACYCYRRHKFGMKALLCNTLLFCVVDRGTQGNSTHTARHDIITLYVHRLSCFTLRFLCETVLGT